MSNLFQVMQFFCRMLQVSEGWLSPESKNCLCCSKPYKGGEREMSDGIRVSLCPSCNEQLPWIKEVKCPVCGRYEECRDCLRRERAYFTCNRSAVRYDSNMKELLASYKYRGNERLAQLLTAMLAAPFYQILQEIDLVPSGISATAPFLVDCITYIPISQRRMQERGFNQAEQLARGIGDIFHLPIIPLLQRTRHTEKQSYKTRMERIEDLSDAFTLDHAGVRQLSQTMAHTPGRDALNIVIVDDVYTTGSTLNQSAKMITSSLRARVYGLSWAR